MSQSAALPDIVAYDGPLLNGALRSIERIASGAILPDEYMAEIGALFDRHPPQELLKEWTAKALAEGEDQVLYRRTTRNTAVWFQLLHMRGHEVHPPHGHRNLLSNQAVLHGRVYLREYDRVARVGPDTVLLKLRSDGWRVPGDRIQTTAVDREVHWFGSDDQPSVQLNFFIAGFQEWTFDGDDGRRGRQYFDPTGDVQADGLILGREIPSGAAYEMFDNKPIDSFPIRRPAPRPKPI